MNDAFGKLVGHFLVYLVAGTLIAIVLGLCVRVYRWTAGL